MEVDIDTEGEYVKKRSQSENDNYKKHTKKSKKSAKSKLKKEKKKKSKKKKNKREESSSEASCNDSASIKEDSITGTIQNSNTIQRDDWMSLPFNLKTVQKHVPVEKNLTETYNPRSSVRELNPYWKSTGTGLPPFQKPKDDNQVYEKSEYDAIPRIKSWKKKPATEEKTNPDQVEEVQTKKFKETDLKTSVNYYDEKSHDEQLNALSAKILKAEIMGNAELCEKLKNNLEELKKKTVKIDEKSQNNDSTYKKSTRNYTEDRKMQRLQRSRTENRKQGERMRSFLQDDKYDIKQMFIEERYTTAADSNREFAKLTRHEANDADDGLMESKLRQQIPMEADRKEIELEIKLQRSIDDCEFCFDAEKFDKKYLVCTGNKFYLSLPWHVGIQPNQCILSPLQHISASTYLDEDSWEELTKYRKCLVAMFAAQGKEVLFFEIAKNVKRSSKHMRIHCMPIPKNLAEMAPFYFKKAIDESEHVWSMNKQLISLQKKSLRNSVPKGLPYFWINFGMDYGFAHVIEDETKFPLNFAEEIIGGMLEIEMNRWRKPTHEKEIERKVSSFLTLWKPYDDLNK